MAAETRAVLTLEPAKEVGRGVGRYRARWSMRASSCTRRGALVVPVRLLKLVRLSNGIFIFARKIIGRGLRDVWTVLIHFIMRFFSFEKGGFRCDLSVGYAFGVLLLT